MEQMMKHIMQMNITWLKIPTGGRQTTWLFTNVTEELNNRDYQETTPTKWSERKLSENKVKKTVEKYDRSENCEKLVAPKVNPEIWGKLTHHGKKQDLRLSGIQNMIVKAGAMIAQSTQKLMDFRGQRTQSGKLDTSALVTAHWIDAIALLGHTNYELSLSRREAIKPNLNKEYASLCSSQTPVTNLLFGDELQLPNKSFTKPPYRQKQEQPFLGKGHFLSRRKPQKIWNKTEETSKK